MCHKDNNISQNNNTLEKNINTKDDNIPHSHSINYRKNEQGLTSIYEALGAPKKLSFSDSKKQFTSGVDPSKYNKGQVIQFNDVKQHLNYCNSNTYNEKNTIFQKKEKNATKNTICVDWFETNLTIKIDKIPDVFDYYIFMGTTADLKEYDKEDLHIELSKNIDIVRQKGKDKIYAHIWKLYYAGELIGNLLTHPSFQGIEINKAQFKIENELLYQSEWIDIYINILNELNWIHNNITRIDIAIDGESVKKAINLIEQHDKGNVIKRKGKAEFHLTKNQNKDIINFHVGSSSSEKVGTIYKKSDEIETSEKRYIYDFWKTNGIQNIDDVHRFELRLKSKITNRYELNNIDNLKFLNNSDYLSSIVKTEVKNWFEFYYGGKDKNKHRLYNSENKTIDWLNESLGSQFLTKKPIQEKTNVYRAKRTVKDLYYWHFNNIKRIYNEEEETINFLVTKYKLHEWIEKKIPQWELQFSKINVYEN